LYRALHSHESGSRDYIVSDVELFDWIDLGNRADVPVSQSVSGSDCQA
jgi:hypothetical protein